MIKKETPMLYSTPMVIAIDQNRKTKTRRTKGLEEINKNPDLWSLNNISGVKHLWAVFDRRENLSIKEVKSIKCPYGKSGDLIWVRETSTPDFPKDFSYYNDTWKEVPIQYRSSKYVLYKASYGKEDILTYKPSIHMPKWAARIWLKIVDIKVERLHDISDEDIINEGIRVPVSSSGNVIYKIGEENSAFSFLMKIDTIPGCYTSKQVLFAHWAELWSGINGRESWDSNPWVWVITFKKIIER